jgi:hypothetical protein
MTPGGQIDPGSWEVLQQPAQLPRSVRLIGLAALLVGAVAIAGGLVSMVDHRNPLVTGTPHTAAPAAASATGPHALVPGTQSAYSATSFYNPPTASLLYELDVVNQTSKPLTVQYPITAEGPGNVALPIQAGLYRSINSYPGPDLAAGSAGRLGVVDAGQTVVLVVSARVDCRQAGVVGAWPGDEPQFQLRLDGFAQPTSYRLTGTPSFAMLVSQACTP